MAFSENIRSSEQRMDTLKVSMERMRALVKETAQQLQGLAGETADESLGLQVPAVVVRSGDDAAPSSSSDSSSDSSSSRASTPSVSLSPRPKATDADASPSPPRLVMRSTLEASPGEQSGASPASKTSSKILSPHAVRSGETSTANKTAPEAFAGANTFLTMDSPLPKPPLLSTSQPTRGASLSTGSLLTPPVRSLAVSSPEALLGASPGGATGAGVGSAAGERPSLPIPFERRASLLRQRSSDELLLSRTRSGSKPPTVIASKVPASKGRVSYVQRLEVDPSWLDFLRYRVDNFFAVQPFSQALLLLLITVLMILGGTALFYFADSSATLTDRLWSSWTFIADPGTHAGEHEVGRRAVAVGLSLGGMLFFAMLVGFVSESISNRVEELKKGRSRVIEHSHTVILGWSPTIIPMLRQLVLANASEPRATIVILAEEDKEVMDSRLAKEILDFKTTRIVTRSGSPHTAADLRRAAVTAAKAIVVLSPGGLPDEADAQVVRTVLALSALELVGHIVVEMCDVDNLDIVRLARVRASVPVIPIVSHDIIGRVIVQCARQPGLAQIFEHVLAFDENELYFSVWQPLVGRRFDEVQFMFAAAVPVGIRRALPEAGETRVVLNPPGDVVFRPGDAVIVLAEDNDSYTASAAPAAVERSQPPPVRATLRLPEKVLFLGWRRDLDDMINELDEWVASGSSLTIMATLPIEDREAALSDGGYRGARNLTLTHCVGVPTLRRDLRRLEPAQFDRVIVLADEADRSEGGLDEMTVDSKSMVAMLLVRDLQLKAGTLGNSTLIAEILDPRTTSLIANAKCSDYVVSNELVAMVLAQVAEQPDMAEVIATLFSESGADFHIKLAGRYLATGDELSFWELTARAQVLREVVVGYRREGQERFVINPADKTERLVWTEFDEIATISAE